MSEGGSESGREAGKEAARKAREERLAAALRANLRRRKAAGRIAAEPAPTGEFEPAPDGGDATE